MKLVLLSGGSGKRLWPLSNDARSKQFLKVLENETGHPVSMVQRVWGQLGAVGLDGSAVVATSRSQVEALQAQIGEGVSLVVEPERRDTFPAIALAASYLHSVLKADSQEVVAILPVDPYVEDRFFEKVKQLAAVLEASNADLALIGVKPTFPSSKYGYIIPEAAVGEARPSELQPADFQWSRVSSFREKPEEELAKRLIEQHALWNCGVFAFRLDFLLKILRDKGLPCEYEALLTQYRELPKISFDYEVVEKADEIAVLEYHGYWKDLGTWNTLTEEMAGPLMGKGVLSADSRNTHIVNELDIPVAVLGLSDIVVAVSPDGILVTDKAASPRIKEVVHFEQRPMFEEKQWGWYRVLDYVKPEGGDEALTRRIGVKAGMNFGYARHKYRKEVWTVLSGAGQFVLDRQLSQVGPGDCLQIPANTYHCLKADSDMEIIQLQLGPVVKEEDIEETLKDWAAVQSLCISSAGL